VLDPCPFDADVIAIAHLILVVAVQFLSQKSGDVVGLDGVDSGASPVGIQGLKIGLSVENDVSGVFALIQAPVVLHA
jgi:hypothetical protein